MKNQYGLLNILMSMLTFSCIDRDTIAGTGKEPPDRIVGIAGNLQEGKVLSTLSIPLRVRILSAAGRPVRGIGVLFLDPKAEATFSDTLSRSDGDGYASTKVTLGKTADSVYVYARVNGLKGSPVIFSLNTIASTGAIAVRQGGYNQVGIVNELLPEKLSVKVLDNYYNPVESVSVFFSTLNGTIPSPVSITNKSGVASASWKLDTVIGSKTAFASFPTIPNVTLEFKATAISQAPAKITALTNKEIHALSGFTVPGGIKVKLTDKYQNPAAAIVRFAVVEGEPTELDTSRLYFSGIEGTVAVPITLGNADTVTRVYAYAPENSLLREFFLFRHYRYTPLDSVRSSNNEVWLYWEKNLNMNFISYTIERCQNSAFDNTTVEVRTISDENITAMVDTTASAGATLFYRIKLNYQNNFYFYTNILQITVVP